MDILTDPGISRSMQLLDAVSSEPLPRDEVGVGSTNPLDALADVWADLESYVMQANPPDPIADELYDLLADNHLRQFLVAYDDVINARYSEECNGLEEIYTEPEQYPIPIEQPQVLQQPTPIDKAAIALKSSSSKENLALQATDEATPFQSKRAMDQDHQYKPLSKGRVKDIAQMLEQQQQLAPTAQPIRKKEEPISIAAKNKVARDEFFKYPAPPTAYNDRAQPSSRKPVTVKQPEPKKAPLADPVNDEDEASISITETLDPEQDELEFSFVSQQKVAARPSANNRVPSPLHKQQPQQVQPQFRQRTSVDLSSKLIEPPTPPPPPPDDIDSYDNDADLFNDGAMPVPEVRARRPSLQSSSTRGSVISVRTNVAPAKPNQQRGRRGSQANNNEQWIDEGYLPEPDRPRTVVLHREHHGEPLGFTIISRSEDEMSTLDRGMSLTSLNQQTLEKKSKRVPQRVRYELVIQRIMAGTLSDRAGTLFPGDVILQFNGQTVSTLDQVQNLILGSASLMDCHLVVKAPSRGMMRAHLVNKARLNSKDKKVYIQTFFSYDPREDNLLPIGDVGLAFRPYEVLELVNAQDMDWWQVRKLNDPHGKARLIPSATTEERRQAQKSATKKKKSITKLFRAADSSHVEANTLLVRSDMWIYEEVVPWPPCTLTCLLLIGPNGVGKRRLKELLAARFPKRFAIPATDTTDNKLQGARFRLLPQEKMQTDIKEGKYVEYGSIGGNFYGIRYSAIREIIASGRTAVLDCQLSTVHLLHLPDFNPYVVFIAAPPFEILKDMQIKGLDSNLTTNNRTDEELRHILEVSDMLSTQYRHLFVQKLINDDMNQSVDKLSRLVATLSSESGWIPAGWAYELSCPQSKNTNYLPGSSNLHALGINHLPPGDRSSVITRSVLSGISGFSEESAARLSRPPSVLGSDMGGSQMGTAGRRLYEKRSRPGMKFQPAMSPMLEAPTPSESSLDLTGMQQPSQYHSTNDSLNSRYNATSRQQPMILEKSANDSGYEAQYSPMRESSRSDSLTGANRPHQQQMSSLVHQQQQHEKAIPVLLMNVTKPNNSINNKNADNKTFAKSHNDDDETISSTSSED